MALVTCPECKKEISDTSKSCPSCGYELKESGKQLCPNCNIEAIAVLKRKQVTFGGIVGIFLFISLFLILIFQMRVIIGIVVMILGLIIGAFFSGKYTAIVCPKCKKVLSKIDQLISQSTY